MGIGRLWGHICIFLLLVSAAYAESFEVHLDPESRSIALHEKASFNFTILNKAESPSKYEIYSPNVAWDIYTSEGLNVEVPPLSNKTIQLFLRPLYVGPGSYGVEINVKSEKEMSRNIVHVGIYSKDQPRSYLPSIHTRITIPRTIDPREPIPITLILKNQNIKPIEKIDIKLRSALLHKDHETSLGALEEKKVSFSLSIDPDTPPQEDTLQATIFGFANDKAYPFDAQRQQFSINAYGDIDAKEEVEKGFLTKSVVLSFTNTGNTEKEATHNLVVDLLNRPFINSNPAPILIDTPDGVTYRWTINVPPGETRLLAIDYDYSIFLYLFSGLVLLLVGYAFYHPPLSVRKAAMVVQKREGGISEIKVIINLKNRTKKPVHEVEVIDLVPPIASVVKKEEAGALPPTKVLKSEKKGSLIKWHIGEVDPNEDRMISYRIRTNLSILGDFKLPAVQVTYKSNIGPGMRSLKSEMESLFGR